MDVIACSTDWNGTTRGGARSRAHERDHDGGSRAALGSALERDHATVLLDDALAEREPDPRSTRLGREEDLEYARQDIGRDGGAAVVKPAAPHTRWEHARCE